MLRSILYGLLAMTAALIIFLSAPGVRAGGVVITDGRLADGKEMRSDETDTPETGVIDASTDPTDCPDTTLSNTEQEIYILTATVLASPVVVIDGELVEVHDDDPDPGVGGTTASIIGNVEGEGAGGCSGVAGSSLSILGALLLTRRRRR